MVLMDPDGQLLSPSGGVQQILAVEFYPKISSNLTGSCQLETLILLTFKPVRKNGVCFANNL